LEVPLFETRFLKVAPQRVVSDDVDPAAHALDLIPRIDRNKAGRLCPGYTCDQAGERQQSIGSRNHIAALGVLLTEFRSGSVIISRMSRCQSGDSAGRIRQHHLSCRGNASMPPQLL
jgi:hypothetical protein